MDYKAILMDKFDYTEFEADLTVEDIVEMDQESIGVLEKYFSGEDVSQYACGDFSVDKLNKEKGYNIIASILSVANLKKDYEMYSELYNRDIR